MVHKGKTDCAPEEVGYNPEILEVLDNHLLGLIQKGISQASGYVIARHGRIFALRSMGKQSSREDKGDFMPDSIRPVASITKVITATAILQLMEQGKLCLHQPVSKILDEFKPEMFHHITFFQLLTHTSGLKSDPYLYYEPYPEDWDSTVTRENWIRTFLKGPLQFKPGTVWNYCSKGFMFLAEVVARLSGMDYDTYVEKNILKPLGMTDSYFYVPDEVKNRVCLTSNEWWKQRMDMKKDNRAIPSIEGARGLFSTLYDLWKFAQMTLNGGTFNGRRILGRKTIEAAVKPQVKDMKAYNWQSHIFDQFFSQTFGLGWEIKKHAFLGDRVYNHEGAEGASVFIDPDEDIVYIGFYPDPSWHPDSWVSSLAIAWSGIE